ncbi:MAG: hydrogenase maturation protease [Acidobacteriota bacterium]
MPSPDLEHAADTGSTPTDPTPTDPTPTASLALRLTEHGYLHFPAELAARLFPLDLAAPVLRGRELWLYPTRGAGGGGLILKQRNTAGDRSVLIWEQLPAGTPPGSLAAFWDGEQGVLRVALPSAQETAAAATARTTEAP